MAPREDLEELRAELRRLYLAASPGRWEAVAVSEYQNQLYSVDRERGRRLLAMPNRRADAELMAAARNALPRLFAEIDAAKRARSVPVLGTVS